MGCEQRVPLWEAMEQCFASPEVQQRVRDLQKESAIELSNQSEERALVGEVISAVALADQISREFSVSDHSIDMEIKFTDDMHEATGWKLYLQLKSGNSYLRERKRQEAGEANRFRGRAVRCDERAAVAGRQNKHGLRKANASNGAGSRVGSLTADEEIFFKVRARLAFNALSVEPRVVGGHAARNVCDRASARQFCEPPWPNLPCACSQIPSEMPAEPMKALWHFGCLAEFAALCSLHDEDESRGS